MRRGVMFAATLALVVPAPAAAAPPVRNILPPGANGLSSLPELGAFLSAGARPAHNDDQLALYEGLLRAPRPFTDATLDTLFKDASFGGGPSAGPAPAGGPHRADSAYGLPHVVGHPRAAGIVGVGYATAHDRLF